MAVLCVHGPRGQGHRSSCLGIRSAWCGSLLGAAVIFELAQQPRSRGLGQRKRLQSLAPALLRLLGLTMMPGQVRLPVSYQTWLGRASFWTSRNQSFSCRNTSPDAPRANCEPNPGDSPRRSPAQSNRTGPPHNHGQCCCNTRAFGHQTKRSPNFGRQPHNQTQLLT